MTATRAVLDTWERGSPYEQYIGRWSRQIAPAFLAWLAQPAGQRWLDVGCGTGALCAAVLHHAAPSEAIGVEPSDGFLAQAAQQLGMRARLLKGDAASLPLPDGSCDVVVSALVLNFIPNLGAALAEMQRVAAPGATIAAYVWDYADGMEIIRRFWDVAEALDPAAAPLHEAVRFPLCRAAALAAAFENAQLTGVTTHSIEVAARFADFDDYWRPFLGGQGPAPAYVASLADAQRDALRDRLRATLPIAADGTLTLRARAWAVRGQRPG